MKTIQSLLIAWACVFSISGSSLADPERATVLIDNPTNKTIHYQFKWGPEGQWKDYALAAGYETTHRKIWLPRCREWVSASDFILWEARGARS